MLIAERSSLIFPLAQLFPEGTGPLHPILAPTGTLELDDRQVPKTKKKKIIICFVLFFLFH